MLRIGQLTGDTDKGVWNISEAWPLMLATVDAIGCLPQIEESLNWLPLDIAATAVLEIAFQDASKDRKAYVYHLVNNSTETTWADLLAWSKEIRKVPFHVVSPTVWLNRLENYPKKHAAKNLLGLWKNTYGNDEKVLNSTSRSAVFSTMEAQRSSSVMQNVLPIDQALAKKIWVWLDEEIKVVL